MANGFSFDFFVNEVQNLKQLLIKKEGNCLKVSLFTKQRTILNKSIITKQIQKDKKNFKENNPFFSFLRTGKIKNCANPGRMSGFISNLKKDAHRDGQRGLQSGDEYNGQRRKFFVGFRISVSLGMRSQFVGDFVPFGGPFIS